MSWMFMIVTLTAIRMPFPVHNPMTLYPFDFPVAVNTI
jgi:hypothetical protein